MNRPYRLGLDVGTNSLGWAILDLDQHNQVCRVRKIGCRIFSDGRKPKDKTSLAVERRLARQARRRRDRFLRRKERLMHRLVAYGLFPSDEIERRAFEKIDPYELRYRGLSERLELGELARAIFHLNQRRGFKSNRILKPKKDTDIKDEGLIKGAISRTQDALVKGNHETVGAYLFSLRQAGKRTRARRQDKDDEYDLFVDRGMVEHEFKTLWSKQKQFHPNPLTDEAYDDLIDTLLYQRRIRPVEPGRCTFLRDKPRAHKALPLAQHYRMYQELSNLRLIAPDLSETSLTLKQRDLLFNELEHSKKLTFAAIRKVLKCGERGERINLEVSGRKYLDGNTTAYELADDNCLGALWYELGLEKQNTLVRTLLRARNEEELAEQLQAMGSFSDHQIQALIDAKLPDGYGHLSEDAIIAISHHLESEMVTYNKACEKAGFEHSAYGIEEQYEELPYYGRVLSHYVIGQNPEESDGGQLQYGKIANPTVHISLNQIRKIVNALIKKYGKPTEIVVEVVRDLKNSRRKKREIQDQQRKNAERNERYKEELENLGLSPNQGNRLRLSLWESLSPDPLNRRCPYTGVPISKAMLFSPEIEIDHIIPFSRSLDDSLSNKLPCTRQANRVKGNQTPYEAFSHQPEWINIVSRAADMPPQKARRFTKEASEQRLDDFLARQLCDTSYIARVAREYLTSILPPESVWVVPGHLTGLLRYSWGLNSILSSRNTKERKDHRHHAIDAAVIACSDRRILSKVSRASAREQSEHVAEIIPLPFENLPQQIEALASTVLVSHKPDHGIEGVLHDATAYGLADEADEKGLRQVVTRRRLTELTEAQVNRVRDESTRAQLLNVTGGLTGIAFKEALKNFAEENNIWRVRCFGEKRMRTRNIKDKFGAEYKGFNPSGNHCLEIIQLENGRWTDEIIQTWDANSQEFRTFQKSAYFRTQSFSSKPLVMRLHKNDSIVISVDGQRRVMRIIEISKGKIRYGPVEAANLSDKNLSADAIFVPKTRSANELKKLEARRVFITPIGELRDPGFN